MICYDKIYPPNHGLLIFVIVHCLCWLPALRGGLRDWYNLEKFIRTFKLFLSRPTVIPKSEDSYFL